jgi:DNA topoisomerase-1
MRWNKMLEGFYTPFHNTIEVTLETAERASGERVLGTEPESGKQVIARMGRFGPMVQIGRQEDDEKPRYAGLSRSQSIETITFEEAMALFTLPRTIGEYEGQEVIVNIGRFGPYIKLGEQYISIPKGEDLYEMGIDRAIELISEKQQADAPVAYYAEKPVTKGKGRFGPFLKWDDIYINVPRTYNFDDLSQEDINELIEKKMEKEAGRFIKQWPAEKISIENGRWGPEIKFNKKVVKLGKKEDGNRYTAEDFAEVSIEDVKKMIEQQIPDAFAKKTKGTKTPRANTKTTRPARKK